MMRKINLTGSPVIETAEPKGERKVEKEKNKQEPSSYKPHFTDLGSLEVGMHY